jgi:hypothetical protein
MKLIIGKNGNARFLYNDKLKKLTEQGKTKIPRASHVEPTEENGVINWYADLAPVSGPKLGPFTLREDALKAEAKWLEDNGIPVPK